MMIAKYIRLSSADEDARYGDKPESNSVTHQRMLLNRYLETHPEFEEYQVLEFQDDGRSGTNFERPGIKAMLEMVRRREIDCVIVKDFSRFGRNYVEVGNYLEQVFPFRFYNNSAFCLPTHHVEHFHASKPEMYLYQAE